MNRLALMEHTGTHMDAPLHFSESDGMTIDPYPSPIRSCRRRSSTSTETSEPATRTPPSRPTTLRPGRRRTARFPTAACVTMNSGWHKLLDSPKFTGRDDAGKTTRRASPETAHLLIAPNATSRALGVDTLSLDPGVVTGRVPGPLLMARPAVAGAWRR